EAVEVGGRHHLPEEPQRRPLRSWIQREGLDDPPEIRGSQLRRDPAELPPEERPAEPADLAHDSARDRPSEGTPPGPDSRQQEPPELLEHHGVRDDEPADPPRTNGRPGDADHATDVMDDHDRGLADPEPVDELVEKSVVRGARVVEPGAGLVRRAKPRQV